MNFEKFVAQKLVKNSSGKGSVSGPIIKIAIGAIALGIAIMIITVATGTGLQLKVRERLSGLAGHIQVNSFENSYNYITKPISKNQNFYPHFEGIPEIKHIQVYANKPGIIRTEGDFEGIVMKGVSTDYDWDFYRESLVDGSVPDYSGKKMSSSALMSQTIADGLKLKVGDKFNIFFLEEGNKPPKVRRLTISGIFNTGLKDFDQNFIISDIRQIQRLNKWDENTVGGFEMILDDFDNLDKVIPEVYHNIGFDLNAVSIKETNRYILEWLNLFDLNIAVILFIMLMVAGINMITALLILILERTQMIGILKALGSNNWSVRKIFLHHAQYLIVRGLLIGNILGIGLMYAQKFFEIIKLDPTTYYVRVAPVNVNLWHILILNIGTLLLVLLMLIIPSYLVTKITPVKAIKFD
ncbi:MAG: FtsX-like permease family protein [Bacteroidota bacterium]